MTTTGQGTGKMQIRRSGDRGVTDFGWLLSRHSFSFGHYRDATHTGFRSLRVLNEDRVVPGRGFDAHPHRDMEILSYVVRGTLEHHDSMGNGSAIGPGEVQVMGAGTGVRHSEFNPSQTEEAHFLQVWIRPRQAGLPPAYGQTRFSREEKRNRLRLVASGDAREGSLEIRQDADVYASVLESGRSIHRTMSGNRHVWVQVIAGHLRANGVELHSGDGLAASLPRTLDLDAVAETELLVFDLA